ncbi:MAG: YdgA family protein [Proteobacteria bacterium]|jgi:uncharacterized protein YdgA (DUF945 family)|nr:YdgA family protein [Pseudomonadota bacterium]
MLGKILRLKMRLGIIIVVCLILFQLITSYLFGFKAEEQLNNQFKQMTSSPFIRVVNYNYHRGVFSSDEVVELALNNKTIGNLLKIIPNLDESAALSQTYSIKYTTHIQHGIFSGILDGYFLPTIAVAKTKIEYPSPVEKVLNKFFANKPPITINNIIYLNKTGKVEVRSPKFNYEEALSGVSILWGGMHLNVNYSNGFDKFENTLSIPQFNLVAPSKGDIAISEISYASVLEYSKNKIKIGNTKLNIGGLKVTLSDKTSLNFKAGDLLSNLTGIAATEFLNELDILNPKDISFRKLSYASVSSDVGGYFGAGAKINLESFITESKVYGPLNVDVSVHHILSKNFSSMIDEVSNLSAQTDLNKEKSQQLLMSILKKNFGPILVNQPDIRLNKFELNTPNGLIELSGALTTSKFLLSDMNNQSAFLSKLDGNISFSVPKNVLSYLFMVQMRYFLSAGNAEIDEQSSAALKKVVNILLDNQLVTWKKKGYLKETHGIVKSSLFYKSGKLSLQPN